MVPWLLIRPDQARGRAPEGGTAFPHVSTFQATGPALACPRMALTDNASPASPRVRRWGVAAHGRTARDAVTARDSPGRQRSDRAHDLYGVRLPTTRRPRRPPLAFAPRAPPAMVLHLPSDARSARRRTRLGKDPWRPLSARVEKVGSLTRGARDRCSGHGRTPAERNCAGIRTR
jgi:hypothetical protein